MIAALGDIIKAHDQIDNGGLAGAGFAHQGHLLTRLHRYIQAPDYFDARLIAKVHIGDLHRATALRRDYRRFPLGDFLIGIQHLKDTLCRRHGGLQYIDNAHGFIDGIAELAQVTDKRLQITHQQLAAEDHHSTHDRYQHIAGIADKAHDGRQHT